MNGVHHHEFFSITLRGLGMDHHLSIFGSFDLFEVTHIVSSRRFHRTIHLEPFRIFPYFPQVSIQLWFGRGPEDKSFMPKGDPVAIGSGFSRV